MIELSDPRLFLVFAAPLAAAAIVFAAARAPWLWTRVAVALAGHAAALGLALAFAARVFSRGGFAFVDIGGWAGARIAGAAPLGLLPAVLTPGTTPILVAVEVAGLLATALLVPHALRARSSAPLAASLTATGFLALLVVARTLPAICGAFSLAGVAGFALLVAFHPQRTDVEGSGRAFLLHSAGDVLLFIAVFVVGSAAGGLDLDTLGETAPAIDPWARAASGALTGYAAREIWILLGALVLGAAASRLAFVVLLPLVRDAVGAPGPALGFAHGGCFLGAGLILLLRTTPILWLAPEVLAALGWLAAAGVAVAGLFALAGRDLVRIDVHLLCAFAALAAFAFAGIDLGTGVLATVVLVLAAVPLCAATGVVVETTGRTDPHALGGLEKALPRTHSTRLCATGALFGPVFTGAAVAAQAAAGSLFSPWLGAAPTVVVVAALPLLAVAAFRPLHLVFTGKSAREPLARRPIEPSPWRTLPALIVAFPLVAGAVLDIPTGILAVLPLQVRYRSPASALLLPERSLLQPLREHVLPALVTPHIQPTTLAALVLGALTAAWIASRALYAGGPGVLHQALFGGPRVQRVVGVLANVAGRESQVARGVGEGAARLSRLIATNLAPGVLDTLLRRIPGLAAALAGAVVRFIANGSAQRGLVVALVVLAILAVMFR